VVVTVSAQPVEPTPPSPVPADPEPVPADADDAGDPVLQLAEERSTSRNSDGAKRQSVQITSQIRLESGSFTPSPAIDSLSFSAFLAL
jgi:hypothetical protein